VKKRSATVRAARWSATHPWRAIALWVVFVAVCSFVGQMAGEKKATDVDMGVGQSGHAAKVLHDAGLTDPAGENVLITARSGSFNQGEAKAVAAEISNRMRSLSGVSKVDSPIVAPDGKALLVPITMKGDPDTAGDRVKPLLNATAAVAGQHPQLRVEEVGDASINDGVNKQLSKDFSKSEKLSVPVTLIILLVAFGAIIAAGVPVLLAISAVVAALGISTLATHLIPSNGSVSEVILLMGMAVGVDYSLFYLKREREERARNRGKIDAIEIAAATSGHSIVVSAMAVIVSMAGLYLAQDAIFSSIATGGVIVVAVAMLGSVTVLPAMLAKLGRAVDRPRVPFLWRLTAIRSGEPRLWPKVLGPTLRHPVRALAISVLVLLGLAGIGVLAWVGMVIFSPTNIALHKRTIVSSNQANTTAPEGGLTDGSNGEPYGAHTAFEDNPWVRVDLGDVYQLKKIKIFNRTDCCFDEHLPLTLEISENEVSFSELDRRTTSFSQWSPWVFFPEGKRARYIQVRGAKGKFVVLSELEAYGKKVIAAR